MLNVSPKRRRHDSRNEIGRSSQRRVCTRGGSDGPGGSAVMRVLSHSMRTRLRSAELEHAGRRRQVAAAPPDQELVLRLQRTIGNRATMRWLARKPESLGKAGVT